MITLRTHVKQTNYKERLNMTKTNIFANYPCITITQIVCLSAPIHHICDIYNKLLVCLLVCPSIGLSVTSFFFLYMNLSISLLLFLVFSFCNNNNNNEQDDNDVVIIIVVVEETEGASVFLLI